MADVPFDAGEKLRWLEAIASDRRAHGLDLRAAVGITNRIQKYEGRGPISQEWLATFTGASERGIRLAADHLVDLGHLKIDRSEATTASNVKAFGGRGKANIYDPVLPVTKTQKTRNHSSGFAAAETRKYPAPNQAISRAKPGTGVPPLPKEFQNTSICAAQSSDFSSPTDPTQLRWLAVKKRLAVFLSPAEVDSWFCQVTVSAITETDVLLIAPSEFVRSRIENNYLGDRLSDAWRAELPTITRVRLVGPPVARAAE